MTFSFFHFQAALAFLVISYIYLFQGFGGKTIYAIFLIPFLVLVINLRSLKFGEARFWGQSEISLAQTIQNETKKDETLYLLGLDSNLYTLSSRLPNTPWLDNFGWYLEIPGVQEEVLVSFEKKPPAKIFWKTPDEGNWYDIGTYQPQMITDWIRENYVKEKEIMKGVWEWRRK